MKVKPTSILLVIVAASLLLLLVISFVPFRPLQAVLGLPFVFIFPGYSLLAALFPRKGVFDGVEKFAVTVGLSMTLVGLIAFILNYSPWKIALYPLFLSVLFFILVMSLIAWLRLRRLGEETGIGGRLDFKPLAGLAGGDKVIAIVVGVSMFLALGTLAYVATQSKVWKPFTEFYVLSSTREPKGFTTSFILRGDRIIGTPPGQKAEQAPTAPGPDEPGKVILNVVNQERQETAYFIKVRIEGKETEFWDGGRRVEEVGPVSLADNARWEREIAYLPPKAPGKYRIEFVLFKGGEEYRHLHLDLTVI